MDKISPFWLLVTSLLSGLVAVLVTIGVSTWLDQREAKRDVLRRIAGNRHIVIPGGPDVPLSGEPFVALNEAFIVFADEPEVLRTLEELRTRDGSREVLVALIKRMAVAADVQIELDDAFINNAFRPRQQRLVPLVAPTP